jgi:hypothetical protein
MVKCRIHNVTTSKKLLNEYANFNLHVKGVHELPRGFQQFSLCERELFPLNCFSTSKNIFTLVKISKILNFEEQALTSHNVNSNSFPNERMGLHNCTRSSVSQIFLIFSKFHWRFSAKRAKLLNYEDFRQSNLQLLLFLSGRTSPKLSKNYLYWDRL